MKIRAVLFTLAAGAAIGMAHHAEAAYKYERLTNLSGFEDGWQVIITNTGATVAAGPLVDNMLQGVPEEGIEGDKGTVATLGDATIFTMAKTSNGYTFTSNEGKLWNSSSPLGFSYSTQSGYFLDEWKVQYDNTDAVILIRPVNSSVSTNNVMYDTGTEKFILPVGKVTYNVQLYKVTWEDDPSEPHDPWAEVYLVDSQSDYSRVAGTKLEPDGKNPDVYMGSWLPDFKGGEISTIGVSFISYAPERDKEYPVGAVGNDVVLNKFSAGSYEQLKGELDSPYHWIVTPDFWDLEGQAMQVAVNIHTLDVAFGKDIQTKIEGVHINPGTPVSYFTLQGVKVANPSNGLFIRVQDGKAEKVWIR